MTPASPIMIYPVTGLPEIKKGAALAELLLDAMKNQGLELAGGDVLVVAQKIISKAEGASIPLNTIEPSPQALDWAEKWNRDPRLVELVLRESRRIVRMEKGVIISETQHGYICANAGIDLSNSGGKDLAILLPKNPDLSARKLREELRAETGHQAGVIVSDSFGRPWRNGLTQVALGVAGLESLLDLREAKDNEGRPLKATLIAAADELASAADLVCGKTTRHPAAIIRGYTPPDFDNKTEGSGKRLLRPPEEDLFR